MDIQEKIEKEQKNIDRFAKNPAICKAERYFYLQMFKENIRRLRENGNIHQREIGQ